jgi:hypothetical protein
MLITLAFPEPSGTPSRIASGRQPAGLGGTKFRLGEPVESRRLTLPEIVDYTRSLPRLWADSGPDGSQALVVAIFARLDVLGFERLECDLTPDAIDLGLDATLPPILELESQIGEFGRGERI